MASKTVNNKNPKNKKNKTTTKNPVTQVTNGIKFIFYELFNVIKGFGVGVFSVFDFIFSFIISFVSYIFWGIRRIIESIWKYGFKMIVHEFTYLIASILEGGQFLLSIVFYEFPLLIYNKCSKYVYDAYLKLKDGFEKTKEKVSSGKTLAQTIKEYVTNKYNEIPFVKEAREKYLASLKILVIDQTGPDAERSDVKQTYRYTAKTREGNIITAYFAALSKLDVYSYLIDEGMTVYEIETSWSINFFHTEASSLKRKMRNKDLVFWLAQLSTYIKAGIPLTDAVKILAKQDKRRTYRAVYDSIVYELTMGESFSEALNKQGNVFPALLINMIKSAELIGDIESTLDKMSDYYQEIEDTKKAIISALTYPIIIFVFAIGITVFLIVFIIPKFIDIYESMDAELNPLTVTIINVSNYLRNDYNKLITNILIVIFAYIFAYKKLKAFRVLMQYFAMHMPVIGKLLISKEMSLFARTFATLNKNNILLTDSIDILRKITNNEIYRGIMFRTVDNLLKGDKISESFKDHWAIPDIAYYMILTGESTGELANMLDRVADFYQKQQRNMIGQIKTFIEPIMIALLAVIVGGVLLAVLIPMFGVYNTIA